jgi:hypothetical protein
MIAIIFHWVLVLLLGIFIIYCLYAFILCRRILREIGICDKISRAVWTCQTAAYECKRIKRETNLKILQMQRKI